MGTAAWHSVFAYDPITPLANSTDEAVAFIAQRDFLGLHQHEIQFLSQLPLPQSIIAKQQPNGSWKYPAGNQKIRSSENYDQIETFRNVAYLVSMFELTKKDPAIAKAAEFLLSFQTPQGDIRGILGNQYTPYYTAAMMELIIYAGYHDDPRIAKGFAWLKEIRQDDGGWAIPLRTLGRKLDVIAMDMPTLPPDRTKPFSHMVSGIVLRAYAAHPKYKHAPEAQVAGKLLLTRLFKKDAYIDRSSADFWLRFSYPFWFTDLLSATDSLAKIGFSKDDPGMRAAVDWLLAHQQKDGLWRLKTLRNEKKFHTEAWLSLIICRVIKQLYD